MSNLFNCPDCKKDVSKTAKVCPHCGNNKLKRQIEAEKRRIADEAWKNMDPKDKKRARNFMIGVLVLIIILICFNLSDKSWNKPYDGQMLEFGGIMYKFYGNGKLEIWEQGNEYYQRSCLCDGKWEMDDDVIVISRLYSNDNCPWMEKYNGIRLKIFKTDSLDEKFGITRE